MKNILIPTDFSKNAYNALFYAVNLFKDEVCNFYVLHSFDVQTNVFTSRLNTEKGKLIYEEAFAEVEKQLIEVILNIKSNTSKSNNHSFETLAITKPLEETVPKIINKKNIDVVIMGTKGATGIKEVLFGSNAIKISKKIDKTPLLLIPENTKISALNNIVFATNFKNDFKDESLTTLTELCSSSKASLKIVSVLETNELSDAQEINKDVLEENIKEISYDYTVIFKKESVVKHINDFVKNLDFDILSMVRYGHDDLYNFTHEATINKLGYRIEKPFLILPE